MTFTKVYAGLFFALTAVAAALATWALVPAGKTELAPPPKFIHSSTGPVQIWPSLIEIGDMQRPQINLVGVDAVDVLYRNADLSLAHITDASYLNVAFVNSNLRAITISSGHFRHFHFEEVDFSGAHLSALQFTDGDFRQTQFSGAQITDSTFSNCRFDPETFTHAVLVNVHFENCLSAP